METSSGGTKDPTAYIEACRDQILQEFKSTLVAIGNVLATDPQATSQALTTAGYVLDDVAQSIRSGELRVGELHPFHAWEVGATRAASGVHPKASLEAGSIFFRIALTHLTERISQESGVPSGILPLMATAMEASLTQRIREASDSYHGFLLNQVEDAQRGERRRIARDLHDRIGHGLSVAHQQLALSDLYLSQDAAKAWTKVEIAQQAIEETIEHLRQVTSELHPRRPMKSLEKALISFVESVGEESADLRLDVNGDETWAEPEVLDEAFLIIREAARNALSHACATVIRMRVDIAPHELRASVRDNGIGFDAHRAGASDGVGMTSMRERSALLGGWVSISSGRGNGCLVELFVPLKRGPHGRT